MEETATKHTVAAGTKQMFCNIAMGMVVLTYLGNDIYLRE